MCFFHMCKIVNLHLESSILVNTMCLDFPANCCSRGLDGSLTIGEANQLMEEESKAQLPCVQAVCDLLDECIMINDDRQVWIVEFFAALNKQDT